VFTDVSPPATDVHVHIRPFRDGDYTRLSEILSRCYRDIIWAVEELRYQDASWDHSRYTKLRLVAEVSGEVVGTGRFNHVPDQYHPKKFWMEICVDPPARRRGVGSVLYAELLAALHARGAVVVRAGIQRETDTEDIRFLTQRGFVEVQRGWQSRLHVPSFDFAGFAAAETRVAQGGIAITTLAAELERDPHALRKAYDLTSECERDVPSVDTVTEVPFDHFVAQTVNTPNAAPDAFFLAHDRGRYVGVSALFRSVAEPGILYQGLTGVLRDYRGRGIATALKLRTVRYARENGCLELRTWNDGRNRPMLRINEALGFVKQPAWIDFEKPLAP
jgi:GNAT superfamily N-acetyltransferase